MELDIWSSDFGLPSIDTNCLQVLAYCRFSGAPVKVIANNNPWFSFSGTLPVFRHGFNTKLTKFSDVVAHLRKQNYSADFKLTKKELADISAYGSMLQSKLEPFLTYLWFLDEGNYVELTRPWFAKRLRFPGNYIIPGQMQRKAMADITAQFGEHEAGVLETLLLKEAQRCLTSLSERLGTEEFFFGKSPTSFDALVFSYLAPVLKVPFPNSIHLINHLNACDNLTAFVTRILKKYFPAAISEEKPSNASVDVDFPHKWRDITLSVLFAATSMLGYAVMTGIVKVGKSSKR